jgi:FMN phosphatase YigB (HAD superfamily)
MKPILFIDFYKTLNHEKYWHSLPPELWEKLQKSFFDEDRNKRAVVKDWMIGKYTSREVNEIVSKNLGVPFDYLWKIFVDDCKTMSISIKTLEKIAKLRDKFTVILMTGNMDSFSEFTAPALHLEKYFDYISNSFHEGKQKDDNGGEIFSEYAKKFNSSVQDSFLIDDTESVCKIFELLGGTAYKVDKEKDVDYYLNILSSK